MAKASLPLPTQLLPLPLAIHSFSHPGGAARAGFGVPPVPAVHQQLLGNAQPTLVLWEQGKELHTSLLYSPEGEGPCAKSSPGGEKQELRNQESWAWLHVRGRSRAWECCVLLHRG